MTKLEFNLNITLGCGLIGLSFATLFHGISLAQTAFYFRNYRDDIQGLRIFVIFLRALDTAKESIMAAAMWELFVEDHMHIGILFNYNNYMRLMAAEFMLTTVTVLTCQLFFLYSIWRVLPKTIPWLLLVAFWIILAFVSFGMGPVIARRMWSSATWESNLSVNSTSNLLISQLSTLLADDLLLATTLCYILHGYRNGVIITENMISRLIMFALQRGVLMCAMDIGILVTVLNDRKNGTSTVCLFYLPMGTVWANAVLASLNARHYLRKFGTPPSQIQDSPLTTFRVAPPAPEDHSTDSGASC